VKVRVRECGCVPCPSRLARLQAPASLSLLSSLFLSSACSERISCEDDLRAGMDVRVLFEGENRRAAERDKKKQLREIMGKESETNAREERPKDRQEQIIKGRW